jgi:arylsulfatase A-like enzyme
MQSAYVMSSWKSRVWPVILWLALGHAIGVSQLTAADRPNIVVFLVDDLGCMDCSVPMLTDEFGKPQRYPLNDLYRTPNIEVLAGRGIRFSNFHAMNVCSPSRISLMTGQNAARHRTTNWINPATDNRGEYGPPNWNWRGLSRDSVTLPGLLGNAGYRTIHIGKGHFGPRNSEGANPLNLGFAINIAGTEIGQPGSYHAAKGYGAKLKNPAWAVPDLQGHIEQGTFLTEALTLEAKRQVSQAVAADQPFFLYLAHYALHSPFDSDPRFADHYRATGKPAAAQAYATLVEGMDKSLGDLLQHLDSVGVAEETLIFFLGDNGGDSPLGEAHSVGSSAPLRGKKGSHYEGGTRTPLIISWAQSQPESLMQHKLPIASGGIQPQLAVIYDLFPTILAVADVSFPENHFIDGSSLAALLRGGADNTRSRQFLMHYPHAPHRSDYFTVWRDGDWKLIYHYLPPAGAPSVQLFNLATDPFEEQDLALDHPKEALRMLDGLKNSLTAQHALLPDLPNGHEFGKLSP